MKKFLFLFAVVAAAAFAVSCEKEGGHQDGPQTVENVFEGAVPTGYFGYAEVSVPAGTETVYIEYTYKDGSTKTIAQAVTPEVAKPEGGKDIEPFGTVKLLFEAEKASRVSVYYNLNEATKADEEESVYTLTDFPVDQIESGEFGKTRYVQMPWNFAWENSPATGNQNTRTYPKDVVFYDAEHNHTLRYTFAYGGGSWLAPEGYVLTDAYEVVDHVVVAYKYNYCGGCGNCPKCMPWGCACGCNGWIDGKPVYKANPDFVPSGDLTASAGPEAIVVDPETPGTTPIGDGAEVEVDENGNIGMDYQPEDVVEVNLPEPAPYVTEDEGFTMYHSSGVVMFDDRWPKSMPEVDYLYDYNDVVVDYDIEALTVANELLETEGWREQVKVTLHVRALGGDDAIAVGLVLENFNTDYVDYVDEYKTLDSWQNAHGELPVWTKTTLQENSFRYDNLEGAYTPRNTNNLRPAVEAGRLQALNSVDGKSTGGLNSGNEVYQYNGNDHVFNPARKLYADWGGAHEDQYDGSLSALYQTVNKKLSDVQNLKLYNTVPGYMNVAGGLYTYTVIYHMKARSEMGPEESAACKANMVDAVVNTLSQNFYLVKKDHEPVGLKGYQPLDCPVKGYSKTYKDRYDEMVNNPTYAANLDLSTTYKAANGMVWGFKCPVLTKHTWELMPFAVAYPHYKEWVTSGGTAHADWYKDSEINPVALVCEW